MDSVELRDLDEARRYVVEGLWLQRAVKPTAATVREILGWAMEIAAGGHPLPPVGFVADVGHLALGTGTEHRVKEPLAIPGWDPAVGRMYEDYVLGKLTADPTFERAGDALRKYEGKDRVVGLAYLVGHIREAAAPPPGRVKDAHETLGVMLPPAVIRALLGTNPADVLAAGWESLMRAGPGEHLVAIYHALGRAGRHMSEALGEEHVAALEDGSALGDMGQQVALRQVRQRAKELFDRLPARPVRPRAGRQEVPTRVLDEDQYPVGGYTSISTKGSVESLLHSQLAYIEDRADEPDLFDLKYARDELFYYSRDENQFLRRRRAFVFVLYPDLIAARFKDPDLPVQRIVMLLSAVLTLYRKLDGWLSGDAIRFEVLFVSDGGKQPLAEEATLATLLLHEAVERGAAVIDHIDRGKVADHLGRLARQAQVHCLACATEPFELEPENVVVTELVVNGPRPEVGTGDGTVAALDGDDPFDVWLETVLRVLQLWV